MIRSEFLIKSVLHAVDVLSSESDLSPRNDVINHTLTHLVQILSGVYSRAEEKTVLSDPRIRAIRPQLLEGLSRAEAEMEKYWAEQFLSANSLQIHDLKSFWYWDNYEQLVDKELECFPPESLSPRTPNGQSTKPVAFVGSGALPLTAIILHIKTRLPVTCIDPDAEACAKAQKLVDRLGLKGISIVQAHGENIAYSVFSTVFIASLVPNHAKEKIMRNVRSQAPDTLVAIRSAEKLHTLLYDPVDETSGIFSDYKPVQRTVHDREIINTTLVYAFNKSARCRACTAKKPACTSLNGRAFIIGR